MSIPIHELSWDEARTEQLTEFVREASTQADPTSVLLFLQIRRAQHQLTQAAEKQLGAARLSWPKFRMLMELQRQEKDGMAEGMQPSQLSDLQQISRNTVSALIASLEKERLISRELHSTDRRKFVIRLTAKGRKALKSNLENQLLLVTKCFSVLSEGERKTLLRLLTLLNSTLAEEAKEVSIGSSSPIAGLNSTLAEEANPPRGQ
jgi:DNA-binding MarR family transcriptional regulator